MARLVAQKLDTWLVALQKAYISAGRVFLEAQDFCWLSWVILYYELYTYIFSRVIVYILHAGIVELVQFRETL